MAGWLTPFTKVPMSMRLSTRSGCDSASSCPTRLPMEWPTMCAFSIPMASMNATASSAMSLIRKHRQFYVLLQPVEAHPIPSDLRAARSVPHANARDRHSGNTPYTGR